VVFLGQLYSELAGLFFHSKRGDDDIYVCFFGMVFGFLRIKFFFSS